MKHTQLLILATPRAGTKYTAAVLANEGLDVGHEKVRPDACVSWKHRTVRAKHVFHQVRNPVDCIRSMTTCRKRTIEKLLKITNSRRVVRNPTRWSAACSKATGLLPDQRLAFLAPFSTWLLWCMLVYLRYNQFLAKLAEWTYRIESLPAVWRQFWRRLDTRKSARCRFRVPRNLNTRFPRFPYGALRWRHLRLCSPKIAAQIAELADGYGYSVA